ncbi:Cytochrome c [Planctomycetes bacterium CA13]|uniref:Cytochrome c n=1 Tax=Novipirellula herctigrandis TaxID=2527986 RepID=A0A5C5YMX6_9BACT|nr:Cytochrome c [Planctomycetes bacterium CA13]
MHSYFRCYSLLICVLVHSNALAEFPPLFNTETEASKPAMDATTAAKSFELPDGFRVSEFASEPDVMNPIAMAWDSRGRLWVAENFTYAERSQRFQLDLRDRVVIYDNTDGDHFKTRTVFTDEVQMLTGIEVGHGGVWLMCPPKLIFIADKDQDDAPDSPGQVMLDGFTVANQNYHNFANGLRFGPDGWLYGRCGGSCPGKIGKPGTPQSERAALEGGIWRYHPTKGLFETLTAGTTNPWGHDWNDVGELFFCNTVIGHLFHMTPGAHHPRPFTLDPNRRTYEMIDFHADHWHFDTGQDWRKSRDGAANQYGGGHAHCGTMIYQSDRWPKSYRGKLFTLNFHGRRANVERIEEEGSGYVLRHDDDAFLSGDPWFRGMDLCPGPDGNVFVIDWSDTGECHEQSGVHRESGRIFKIAYGDTPQPPLMDLRTWTERDLADAHNDGNQWKRRQARLECIRRSAAGVDLSETFELLQRNLGDEQSDASVAVQSLLTLHVCGAANRDYLTEKLNHTNPYVRCWAIRLLTETWPIDDCYGPDWKGNTNDISVHEQSTDLRKHFLRMAREEDASQVRLALASALQRLAVADRASLAIPLVAHAEDASDHNLPLMIWYGLIPVAQHDATDLVPVAMQCQLPTTLRLIARCLAEEIERQPEALESLLSQVAKIDSTQKQQTVLEGVAEGLRGWKTAPQPSAWVKIAALESPQLQSLIRELSAVFGDGRTLESLRKIAIGTSENPDQPLSYDIRLSALQSLIQSEDEAVQSICEKLLSDARMNVLAATGLARFDDPQIAKRLIGRYNAFRGPDRPQIISLLSSRKSFASELLDAIDKGKIPRSDLSAFQVRQIQSMRDESLNQRLGEVWGQVHDTPEAKRKQIEDAKQLLTPEHLDSADLVHGRSLFVKHCQNCHRLFGEGGNVGPDMSGADRSNLDYLLSNIVDPSGVVDKNYRMTIVLLDDGRVINGLVTDQSDRTMTIHTNTESMTIDVDTIEFQKLTDKSPMPEGLIETLTADEVRDLIGYLSRS